MQIAIHKKTYVECDTNTLICLGKYIHISATRLLLASRIGKIICYIVFVIHISVVMLYMHFNFNAL